MTKQRKEEIFSILIEYVVDHCSTKEDKEIAFKNIIGLTDAEIKELNIE